MRDLEELRVTTVIGAGPHPVQSDLYELMLELGGGARRVTLLLSASQAAMLARLIAARPPEPRRADPLIAALAALDT
jgi:hypothetical protein